MDDCHAKGYPNLVGGQADALGVVHRLDHVVDELADAAVDVLDLPRLLSEDGMGRVYQWQDGQLR